MDKKTKLQKLLENEEEYEYEDVDIYEEEEEEEEEEFDIADICGSEELTIFVTLLASRIVNDALNKGIRIIFDLEPLLYESVFNLYSVSTYCSKAILKEDNGVVVGSDGKPYRLTFSLFKVAKPGDNEILVVFMREKPEKFWEDFETLVAQPRLVYFIVTQGRPQVNVSTAVFFRNLVSEIMRETFLVMYEYTKNQEWKEKIKYIGRVPFDVLLHLPLEVVEKIARTWTPPPPPNADYLHKKERSLDEVILPDSVKREIIRFIELSRVEGRGSLLLIGLPSSGRKTIAKAIAVELGLPAYHISISNILSRWVGESESKLKAFFEGMRARGGLAVFENVEALFRKRTGENVTANLRTLLYQEMAREDNNFVIVFTSNEDASPELFDSPLLGETKLVIPPPTKEERKKLARMFLREIFSDNWETMIKIASEQYGVDEEKAETTLYNMYADPFAGAGVGLTSGELYRIMKRILIPTLPRILEKKRLVDISNDIILLTKRDYTARQAKLKTLKERAVLLGHITIADSILNVEEEVRSKAIEVAKIMEKYKEY
jgi:hypothetical protein